MSEPRETTPARRGSRARSFAFAAGVGLLAFAVFGVNLDSERQFVDESAYLSQSFYADLWLEGDRNNASWLSYPAFDLPPLPKYLIGLALRVSGYPRPGPEAAWRWYHDTSFRAGSNAMIVAARWPSVVLGALGCVALYALGSLAGSRWVGVLAALLLMFNPLYRLHARSAMADVPTEAFILATAAVALWGWQAALGRARGGWLAAVFAGAVAGVLGGLAVLCKLNGGLGLMIEAGWAILAVVLPRVPVGRKLRIATMTLVAGLVSYPTFVALNPFLTAHPGRPLPARVDEIARMGLWSRTRQLVLHRIRVSSDQREIFPHNALNTPREKLEVVVVQGFGRFGLFGPRHSLSIRRFDWSQDAGALVWLPLVAAGFIGMLVRGWSQNLAGEPPTAWAIAVQAIVVLGAVTAYIPLAWDRYFLSLQPVSALLVAGVIEAAADRLAAQFRRRPEA
jgi:4-amino-4-deoxy-L-arabinose transferase-like glycosyltransferase